MGSGSAAVSKPIRGRDPSAVLVISHLEAEERAVVRISVFLTFADDGVKALERAQELRPNILVTEILVPKLVEAVTEIIAERKPSVIVIDSFKALSEIQVTSEERRTIPRGRARP